MRAEKQQPVSAAAATGLAKLLGYEKGTVGESGSINQAAFDKKNVFSSAKKLTVTITARDG